MTEDGQEHVPSLIDATGITGNGFGDRLIDGLVEAGEVINIAIVGRGRTVVPKPKHAGAESAILAHHLQHVEAQAQAIDRVQRGRAVEGVVLLRMIQTLGFLSRSATVWGDFMSRAVACRICPAWSRSASWSRCSPAPMLRAKISHSARIGSTFDRIKSARRIGNHFT